MYSCGPTVYNVAHIGNLTSFLAADVVKRYLRLSGWEVKQVMNITDVDDKTIRGAHEAQMPLAAFTQAHEARFLVDLERLNIDTPEVMARATEHIDDMVKDIQVLLEKGMAYEEGGSVYFSIAKDPDYGALAHLSERRAPAKHRVDADEYDKDAVEDFVLWKAWKEEDGDVFWDTALGKGRPGWHIECSAMARKYLGEQIDVHTGGADLLFPHHTNETAQAEAASGKRPFVRHWLHRGFLTVNDEKMAKRIGNVLSLADIAKTDLNALAFRYLVVSSHYRAPLNFNEHSMPAARVAYGRLLAYVDALETQEVVSHGKKAAGVLKATRATFFTAMDDDLNTPQAIAAVFELVDALPINELSTADRNSVRTFLLEEMDAVLGVLKRGLPLYRTASALDIEEEALIKALDALRAKKDFSAADAIRAELEAQGVMVQTTPSGTVGRRNPFA